MSAQLAPFLPEADPRPGSERSLPLAREQFTTFEMALAKAELAHRRGRFDAAAAYAGAAALTAMRPHAGFFVSPRIERMLVDVGRRTSAPTRYRRPEQPRIRRVLHVASELMPVGGLINNLAHWLRADASRTHSLAVINQRGEIPDVVTGPVERSGGRIYRINRTRGHQVAWARRLRKTAQGYDAVVLHHYGQDPVPLMAFAEPRKRPPVLLLNHADHMFWLGASIADVVINMREAAQDLSVDRRSIAQERNIVVPTVISPPARTRTREAARRELGIAPDAIVLFSAARAIKYRTVDGVTYPAPLVPLLKKYPKAELIVLGAGEDRGDWKAESEAVGGRIRSLAESPNAQLYLEAADIYLDSYPFVSSTSMMEAAGLGLPLVSRFYGPKGARIFAINHPGIDKVTLHAATEQQFVEHVERLIADPQLRAMKGRDARESVLYAHTPPSWLTFLERAYALAERLPPVDSARHFAPGERETFSHGEPDCSLYDVFGFASGGPGQVMRGWLGVMPFGERLRAWRQLGRQRAFHSAKDAVRLLLPDWLVRRVRG